MGNKVYIMVEVGNPAHAACHIWSGDRWLMPSMSHDDLLKVENEMPEFVKYLGNAADIEHPVVPKTTTRYMSLVWELTDEAFAACVSPRTGPGWSFLKAGGSCDVRPIH